MSAAEAIFSVLAGVLVLLVIGNIAISFVAERRNPPIGSFIECEGLRLHYLDRGDPAAPCVVLFHGNGSMIQDLLHGTADQLIEPEQARRLHEVLSHSDLHLVNDAGHMVTYADDTAIARAVDSLGATIAGSKRIGGQTSYLSGRS